MLATRSLSFITPKGTFGGALRFFLYYCYLNVHAERYEQVFLTDVRDVVFQKDPFDFPFAKAVCVFSEPKNLTIRADPYNSRWIRDTFGDETLHELGDNPVVCAGTIVGPANEIRQYCSTLVDIVLKQKDPANVSDQAVHNYMTHKRLFPNMRLYDNDTGPVLTMGMVGNFTFNAQNQILNSTGDVVNILHQYDRDWDVAKRFYGPSLILKQYPKHVRAHSSKLLRRYLPICYRLLIAARNTLRQARS
jgi:hypothetical protein